MKITRATILILMVCFSPVLSCAIMHPGFLNISKGFINEEGNYELTVDRITVGIALHPNTPLKIDNFSAGGSGGHFIEFSRGRLDVREWFNFNTNIHQFEGIFEFVNLSHLLNINDSLMYAYLIKNADPDSSLYRFYVYFVYIHSEPREIRNFVLFCRSEHEDFVQDFIGSLSILPQGQVTNSPSE